MRFDPASRFRTCARPAATRLALALIAALVGASTPAAAVVHYLNGNARFQIGNGLPFPVTLAPAPVGAVQATASATVQLTATTGGLLGKLVIQPGQLSGTGSALLGHPLGAPQVFQQRTALSVQFPASTASFEPNGRTGAATVTFCPGNVITIGGNGCLAPAAAPGAMRYTRTGSQFGGPAIASVLGSVSVARGFGASAPCSWPNAPSCTAIFIPNTLPGGFGGPFGFSSTLALPAPNPGHFQVSASAGGFITALGPALGPGLANTLEVFAGPWTTGRVTVTQSAAIPAQLFILSGSDARTVSGQGSLSLVSGAIVTSSVLGANAGRGWLQLTVLPEPSPGPSLAVCAAVLGALSVLRRRRHRRSAPPPASGTR